MLLTKSSMNLNNTITINQTHSVLTQPAKKKKEPTSESKLKTIPNS